MSEQPTKWILSRGKGWTEEIIKKYLTPVRTKTMGPKGEQWTKYYYSTREVMKFEKSGKLERVVRRIKEGKEAT